jgi:hypothetical protein
MLTSRTIIAVAAVCGGMMMTTNVAHAAKCMYASWHPFTGEMIVYGVGAGAKKSWACNSARRICKRRLNRARKKGATAKDCVRVTNMY